MCRKCMGVSTLDDGSDVICIPVYLNQKAAMYVCAHALSDSLEYSYKLLGNVLDCVPAGVAALEAFRNAYDFDICIL